MRESFMYKGLRRCFSFEINSDRRSVILNAVYAAVL